MDVKIYSILIYENQNILPGIKMKLFCKELNREIEIETFIKETGGSPAIIIKHNSLERIFNNELQSDAGLGILYNFTPIAVSPAHNVFLCTISDAKNRRIQAIGESLPKTLDNSIAKSYPATIASQRAFDRAMIRYLNLPGRVLSDLEISQDELASLRPESQVVNVEDASVLEDDNQTNAESNAETGTAEIKGTKGETEAANIPDIPNNANPVYSSKEAEISTLEKAVIDFGKFKGQTIKEINTQNRGYLEWASSKGYNNKLVPIIKRYLELTEQ